MKTVTTLSVALALTLGLSQASLAQGKGHDKGQGQGGDKHADGGGKHANQGNGQGNGKGKGGGEKHADRVGGPDRVVVTETRVKPGHVGRVELRPGIVEQRIVVLNDGGGRGLIGGCPPGLAKKHNGCMPPGQARKLAQGPYGRSDFYERLLGYPTDNYRYRYDDGYLYRYDRQGGLLGWLPALGGALAVGNLWPQQYGYQPAPRYQQQYYGFDDRYDYRYADGAIYGVDRNTSSISQIAALMTGQSPVVGQRMPPGYDIYNVPYSYRDRYYDTPERAYRYNDGMVYQVDPTTQLVQAIIQLLT